MIRRLLVLASLVTLAAGVAACRAPHLGPGYGRTFRNAFHAQEVNHAAQPPAPQDASDAQRVLSVHRSAGKKKGPAGAVGGFQLQPLSLEAK